jgi:hypothetical protein
MHRILTVFFACGVILVGASASSYAAQNCDVTISIEPVQDVNLGVVSVNVDYSATYGTFVNGDHGVVCTSLDADTALIGNDSCAPDSSCYAGSSRNLVLVASSTVPAGVQPQVARCRFVSAAGREPTPDQFVVTTLSATVLPGTDDTDPLPVATVSAVDCTEGN